MTRVRFCGTGDHAVDGLVEGAVVDQLGVGARRQQRSLVQHVREVGAGEAGRLAGEHFEVDAGGERLAATVHLEDLLAAVEVGSVDADLAVETTGTQQRRVEDVGAVRRRDHDDVRLDVEAVHLDEELVQRLLALVVSTAEACATVTADRVDLVDEDDRRGVLLGLLEQVAHTARADTDEHLDEVRTGDRVEGNARLTGDGACEKRLARSGRAVQQHALRDAGPDRLELGRLLEEVFDLLQFFDRLVAAGDVVEGDLRALLRDELGLRLAELHDLVAAALHAGEHDPEEHADQQHGQEEAERREQPVGLRNLVVEALRELRVVDGLHHVGTARRHVVELHLAAERRIRAAERQVDALLAVDDLGACDLVVLEQLETLLGRDLFEARHCYEARADPYSDDGQHDVEDRAPEDLLDVHGEARVSLQR